MLREVKRAGSSIIFSSLSAILLSLSMPGGQINLSVLEWFALVPWLLAIREKKFSHVFLLSFWSGILFWGITISWLHLVTGIGFFFLLPYLGLYFAIFGMSASYIIRRCSINFNLHNLIFLFLGGPLFWLFLEHIRGCLFGGFPWLNLSHGQYLNIPLLQWASLAGEGIISGMIILVNLIIVAIFLSKGKKKFLFAAILFIILLMIHLSGEILLERRIDRDETLRVALIQPNITLEKWDRGSIEENFNILMEMSYESIKENPEIIIWPETSPGIDLEKDSSYLERLKEFAARYNLCLLAGSIKEASPGEFYNRALLISPDKGITSYDKVKLVPFGEYIPLGGRLPWFSKWIENIAGYRPSFIPAEEQKILHIGRVPFGVLICFEDIFPRLSRRFSVRGVRFLVNMTDDHWFGKTSAPYQHLAASVMRACENRLPLIRVANTGISCFIDSSGRIIEVVKKEGTPLFIRGICIKDIHI